MFAKHGIVSRWIIEALFIFIVKSEKQVLTNWLTFHLFIAGLRSSVVAYDPGVLAVAAVVRSWNLFDTIS